MIEATAQQWIWRYEYPDGTYSYYDLVVPVDTAIVVKLGSTDVVHRWWVPGLGGKFDAVPDQSNQTWFKADEEGSFDGASYQFSGASYVAMRTRVQALSVSDYEAWLADQADGHPGGAGLRPGRGRGRHRARRPRRVRPGGRAVSGVDGNGRAFPAQRPELVTNSLPQRRPAWIETATSTDHKDVGRMFIAAALSFLAIALLEFMLMRLQLAIPENTLIEPVTFNRLLSVFSASAVVLFAVPLAIGLFTYIVPLQIGARSLAFPKLALFSVWIFILGGATLYASFVYTPPEAGFNSLPPLSDAPFIDNNGPNVWLTAVGLSALGFTLQSINLIVTISRMRAPGLAWRRLPPFTFAATVSSWVMVVAGPAMLAAMVMLLIDRQFDGVFFDPGESGAPTYYQHLTWLFFTGCYLLFVLPAAGAISEILPAFSRKPLPSRGAVAASMIAIAVLGMLAWMQNMFTASIPVGFLYAAMAAALLLLVPFGVLFVNWLATLAFGSIELRAPMLFALGAISTLSIGLAAELLHAVIPVNWLLADTDRRDGCDRLRLRRGRRSSADSRRSTTGSRR